MQLVQSTPAALQGQRRDLKQNNIFLAQKTDPKHPDSEKKNYLEKN